MVFDKRAQQLRNDLTTQGQRVVEQTLRAVECYFDRDRVKAASVIQADDVIDRVDVEIERASIPLLALGETDERKIRSVLMIVKINNELERAANCAKHIADVVETYAPEMVEAVPSQFRVMANSVIGMLRDAIRAFDDTNVDLARQVLAFDDTVASFKREIGLDAERQLADGNFSVSFAFRLRTVTALLERIADHATNISEQVIYYATGKTVRHLHGGWSEPALPN